MRRWWRRRGQPRREEVDADEMVGQRRGWRRKSRAFKVGNGSSSTISTTSSSSSAVASPPPGWTEAVPLPPPSQSTLMAKQPVAKKRIDDERQWEWPCKDVVWGKQLGAGSFGSVYLAETHGLRLAAKCMSLAESGTKREASVKTIRREALALRKMIHPNVVEILGLIVDAPTYIALLMELADYGSLRDMMDTHGDALRLIPLAQLRIATQVANGMAFLHSQEPPILHRDLKSANILLFDDPNAPPNSIDLPSGAPTHLTSITAKLCDFGLASGLDAAATVLQSTRATGGGAAGTLAYTSPESFDDGYDLPGEVYAFGIILWELLTCELPWSVNKQTGKPYTSASLMRAVLSGQRPELPSPPTTSETGLSILGPLAQRCWQGEAAARPRFEQITRQLGLALRQMNGGSTSRSVTIQQPEEASGSTTSREEPPPLSLMQRKASNEKLTHRTMRKESEVHRSHLASNSTSDVHKTRAGRATTRAKGKETVEEKKEETVQMI